MEYSKSIREIFERKFVNGATWHDFEVDCLLREIDRLQSVEKAQEWIPVSERLPELSMEYYFVFLTNERTEKAVFMAKNARGPRWMIAGTHRDIEKLVTHWRPLPPPPTGGKNE